MFLLANQSRGCADLSLSVGWLSFQLSLPSSLVLLLAFGWTAAVSWLVAGGSASLSRMKLFFTSTSSLWGRLVEKSSAAISTSSSSSSSSSWSKSLTAWWLLPVEETQIHVIDNSGREQACDGFHRQRQMWCHIWRLTNVTSLSSLKPSTTCFHSHNMESTVRMSRDVSVQSERCTLSVHCPSLKLSNTHTHTCCIHCITIDQCGVNVHMKQWSSVGSQVQWTHNRPDGSRSGWETAERVKIWQDKFYLDKINVTALQIHT